MAGSINGDMKNAVRNDRPGRLPRASAKAQAPPITIDSTSTQPAIHSDSSSAFVNSGVRKNFSNQRKLTPTGGKEMYGVGLSANTSTMAIGASRKVSRSPFRVR